MDKFIVRGPGKSCNEIMAGNLEQAVKRLEQQYPGKKVAYDAADTIYVCQPNEDETACQMNLLS